MLPEFDENRLLPPTPDGSPHQCTAADVEERFVTGRQPWRRQLYDGWDILRRSVAVLAPSTTWWLWGNFVTGHEQPLFGGAQRVDALAVIPASDLQADLLPMITDFFRTAHSHHHTDASYLFTFDDGDARNQEATDVITTKWRPRATRNIADYESKLLVPAGFVEVLP